MPTGDAVQKRPSFDEEANKFKGYTTNDGEIVDPKTENLNPVAQNISDSERKAGAKTVAEAAKAAAAPAEEDTEKSVESAEKPEQDSEEKPAKKAAADNEEAIEDDEDDNTKTISVAEAKKMAGKRIGELTKKNRSLERRLENMEGLEERLRKLESGGLTPQNQAVNVDTAPNPEDFELGEMDAKYIKALARFEARQETQEAQRKDAEKRQREADARQQREIATKKAALETAGDAEYDDFQEVVIESAKWSLQNQDAPEAWPLSAVVGELAFDSKVGHKVLYHLATHPDEARRIFALSPGAQGAWFARKETELSPPPTSGATGTPPPKTSKVPPVPKFKGRGGSGTTQVPSDSNDFAAVEAAWRNGSGRRPN